MESEVIARASMSRDVFLISSKATEAIDIQYRYFGIFVVENDTDEEVIAFHSVQCMCVFTKGNKIYQSRFSI